MNHTGNKVQMTWDEYYRLFHDDLKRWREERVMIRFTTNASDERFFNNYPIEFLGEKTRCAICDTEKD